VPKEILTYWFYDAEEESYVISLERPVHFVDHFDNCLKMNDNGNKTVFVCRKIFKQLNIKIPKNDEMLLIPMTFTGIRKLKATTKLQFEEVQPKVKKKAKKKAKKCQTKS
jgi:hypothetical protein